MGAPARQRVAFTTDAGGDAVELSRSVRGSLIHVVYIPDAVDTPGAGTTLKIEALDTGLVALNDVVIGATRKEFSPRLPTHEPDGTVLEHEAAASPVSEPLRLAKEQLRLTIASGGDTKSGTIDLLFE